jgi:hypothetical protein
MDSIIVTSKGTFKIKRIVTDKGHQWEVRIRSGPIYTYVDTFMTRKTAVYFCEH